MPRKRKCCRPRKASVRDVIRSCRRERWEAGKREGSHIARIMQREGNRKKQVEAHLNKQDRGENARPITDDAQKV